MFFKKKGWEKEKKGLGKRKKKKRKKKKRVHEEIHYVISFFIFS